ncbi:MAG: type III-B CRISPR module RAMP protein Cmr4 [Promethearchaeota archaeon]
MKNKKMFWMHALSPIHVGTGQGTGFIDLPIMREKHTQWPVVPGSSFKGALRNKVKDIVSEHQMNVAFGSGSNDLSNSGAIVLTDAKILCMPIRSMLGTFAYVTCPLVLEHVARDLVAITGNSLNVPSNDRLEGNTVLVTKENVLASEDGDVYLDDMDFKAREGGDEWADFLSKNIFNNKWENVFKKRFAIIPDDTFAFFSTNATEVNARIKIDEKRGTTVKGALWYEEVLPPETILYGFTWCDIFNTIFKKKENNRIEPEKLLDDICPHDEDMLLIIGGNASTGQGRVNVRFTR